MTPAATLRFSRHATFALVPYRTLPLAQHHQLTDVAALVPERAGQGAALVVLLALDPVFVLLHAFKLNDQRWDLCLDRPLDLDGDH